MSFIRPARLLLCLLTAVAAADAQVAAPAMFSKTCFACHSAKLKTADLDLTAMVGAPSLATHRDKWQSVLDRLKSGEMPPKGVPRPPDAEMAAATHWIEAEFDKLDRNAPPNPGRIIARRLNRTEYNNTIRDLLAVEFRPADDFPVDDSGYGFDNIGDVLSLSPVLMEKYLAAAEKVSHHALFGPDKLKPTMIHYQPLLRRPGAPPSLFEYDESGLSLPSAFSVSHRFPLDGEYLLKLTMNGQRPGGSDPVTLAVWMDGKQIQQFEIAANDMEGESRQFRTKVTAGQHVVSASFLRQFEGLPAALNGPKPSTKVSAGRRGAAAPAADAPTPGGAPVAGRGGRGGAAGGAARVASYAGRVEAIDVGGPFEQTVGPSTASLKAVYTCGHLDGHHQPSCARTIVSNLARRAWRRPVKAREIDVLAGLVAKAQQQGDSFEEGVGLAIDSILIAPDFLFRIETSPAPGSAPQSLSAYELASRLSYFLWSSMPDDALLSAASQGSLATPQGLEAQVRRMLKDPKASSLVENFAAQWLQFRNIDVLEKDGVLFPEFDDFLRHSMRRETELFLSDIVANDRSILEMIDGKYTFLDERLARYYGIPSIAGPEFRRVDLTGTPRAGILTQGSILTVSSYATRTSPVLRGKWILENILNTPPPPPPPNVPSLNESEVGSSASLRQQMEKHRDNAVCASCHSRMDPLGFGLENFDAAGVWRTSDGKFPIDATGSLPDGRSFEGPAGLATILKSNPEGFAQCLTEKLMTFGLGRGLESYDRIAVKKVVDQVSSQNYRFSSVVLGIVNSVPFRMKKGESSKP